jgi:hypothetical protein
MPKHRALIMEELDPQSVEGITETKRTFYESIGYKPYLDAKEKVVWLSPEFHALRIHAKCKQPLIKRLLPNTKIKYPKRRKHRTWITKFFKHNWLLFIIITVVMAFVLFYLHYYM